MKNGGKSSRNRSLTTTKKRILITGSNGMLGIDLCNELNDDYEVIGIDVSQPISGKLASSPWSFVSRYCKADITDRHSIESVIMQVKPDVVIHSAAWTDVDGCEHDAEKAYKVNADGAKNVAHACKKAGSVLVFISTDFVFDGRSKKPYREAAKPKPLSVYGDSKFKGEKGVQKTLKEHFILRTSWLYGKYGKNFVDTILAKSATEEYLRIVDDQIGSPTYTKDLARAIHSLVNLIAKSPNRLITKYGIYHVSNSGKVSWFGYAKQILKCTRCKTALIPILSDELNRPAKRPAMSVLDNSKFYKLTKFKMRSWRRALKDYIYEDRKLKVRVC